MKPLMLDLFSGVAGFSLAGDWAGFETAEFVEIEPFCQAVIRKHFPGKPIHGDIRTYSAEPLRGRIAVVTGGFPCQPFSVAGEQKGEDDERFLWPELLRVIREVEAPFILLENVPGLRNIASDRVLSELEKCGYTCGAFVVGADDVGAPHRRKRVWIVAHRNSGRQLQPGRAFSNERGWIGDGSIKLDNSDGPGPQRRTCGVATLPDSDRQEDGLLIKAGSVPDPERQSLALGQSLSGDNGAQQSATERGGDELADTQETELHRPKYPRRRRSGSPDRHIPAGRMPQSRLGGAVTGLSRWMDGCRFPARPSETQEEWEAPRTGGRTPNRNNRLKALGNAIVPQVAYLFLSWIYSQLETSQ